MYDRLGVYTMRLTVKPNKKRNSMGTRFVAELSGAKSLIDMFRRDTLKFNCEIRMREGDTTRWSIHANGLYATPELEGAPTNNEGFSGYVASPARSSVYPSPGGVRRSPRLAARESDMIHPSTPGFTRRRSRSRSPVSTTRRNLVSHSSPRRQQPARAAVRSLAVLDDSEPESEPDVTSPDIVAPSIENYPFENASKDEVSDVLWDCYPAWEDDHNVSVNRQLEKAYKFTRDACVLCGSKGRRGAMSEWKQCVGVMGRKRCIRKAHSCCCGREIFLCMREGCLQGNPAEKELSKKLIYLYYHGELAKLLSDKVSNRDALRHKVKALASNVVSLIRIVEMQ